MLLKTIKGIFLLLFIAIIFVYCNNQVKEETKNPVYTSFASLNDTVKYIGISKCLECHPDKKTFLETGMGQSFGLANQAKSIIDSIPNPYFYDHYSNFHYKASISQKGLQLHEYRLNGKDTVDQLIQQVSYVIGSGHHTNSHMMNRGGYVYQMPFTFYAQKKIMDIPPGFEKGFNTRYSRKIGLECMTCHNALPGFVQGSENKFSKIPNGIDCERCHGPGEAHLAQFISGNRTDTASKIDYTIVNPAKLSVDLQFDVCQRCHLQGNAVLKEGKSFLDFKPGMKLSDYLSVYLPKYENGDEDFIMASHADRLKQSKCFIESYKKAENKKSIKPYKNALTCVTCHNPHVSVKKAEKNYFNQKCLSCHQSFSHQEEEVLSFSKKTKNAIDNCVACHMPNSGSIDIPHVSIHDHYIRKPLLNKEVQAIKKFAGLKSINNPKPNVKENIKAYLQQYEKFEKYSFYLDSAYVLLSSQKEINMYIREWINYYFLKDDFNSIIGIVNTNGTTKVLQLLKNKSADNYDAWTLYRIAESFNKQGLSNHALAFIREACMLAPYNLEFNQKLANNYYSVGNVAKAKSIYQFILKEDKDFVNAISSLGFILLTENKIEEANKMLVRALKLDPDNEQVILNNLSLELFLGNKIKASRLFNHLKKLYPTNPKIPLIKKEYKL